MKRIFITGAASGLGLALATYYSAKGWSVCIADIQVEAGEAQAEKLKAEYKQDCFFLKLDVTSEDEWHSAAAEIGKRWQGLDCLVNNAGVASSGDIDQLSMKDFQWTMDINVMGVVKGCYVFTPMIKKNKGTIINVASMAGLIHMSSMSAYNASKAAVVALSETMYAELSAYGVHVGVLCPAFFQTNLTKNMRVTDNSGLKIANKLMERSKIQAEDVAKAVYDAVENKTFYILTHPKEKMYWRLKRFLPSVYFSQMKKMGSVFKRANESSKNPSK
jgi:short-subunit dehydrogenase